MKETPSQHEILQLENKHNTTKEKKRISYRTCNRHNNASVQSPTLLFYQLTLQHATRTKTYCSSMKTVSNDNTIKSIIIFIFDFH